MRKIMVNGVREDNRGAPASNAGDRFHELWALRKALSLLDPDSPYKAMTVEGVPLVDSNPEKGNWDAVDVCLMEEGESLGEASFVVFAQLKYSTSNPTSTWTVARLTESDAKKSNNSPIRKLAESFIAAENAKKSENPNLKYKLQLVSNQPINEEVLLLCGKIPCSNKVKDVEKKKTRLIQATGLTKRDFEKFTAALDFSECGSMAIFEQETNAIHALQNLIEGNPRQFQLELLRYLSDEMMPGRTRTPITEYTLLARLGIMNEEALFPCPASIKQPNIAVHRKSVKDVTIMLKSGTQYLAIHGGAGCGKTTTVSMLAQNLPRGSISVVFDCYGGGSYLDASKPRHRPREAFTQMSNELAARLQVPRLLRISDEVNAAKAFRERLELAADILMQSNSDAILLIVVDAADNAVSAATRSHEQCFVHEFVSLQNLPSNVRLIVSARSSRRAQLNLPPLFVHEEIQPFSLAETSEFLRLQGAKESNEWIADFHRLTLGIPRVQTYSFGLSRDLRVAMKFLLPDGKNLNQIFEQTVKTAWERGGGDTNTISILCAALIALPRPVPMEELAHATGLNLDGVMDLCADLFPTIRLDAKLVSFGDEDFEDYVASRGASDLAVVRIKIAQEMLRKADSETYAACHVVSLLIDAGMEKEALAEAMKEPSEKLFPDPVMRRICHLERMRSALKVCSRTGNGRESLTILLIGAEALRTSDAIADMLARNASLATKVARDAVDRLVLTNEKYFAAHGPVLCHYMAHDAKEKLFSRVAYSKKMFFTWNDVARDENGYREHSQAFTFEDGGAFCYAVLEVEGTKALLQILIKQRKDRYKMFSALVERLLNQREVKLLEDLLSLSRLKTIERIHVLVSLIRLGVTIDPLVAEAFLTRMMSKGMFDIVSIKDSSKLTEFRVGVLEIVENMIHIRHSTAVVEQILAKWGVVASSCNNSRTDFLQPLSKFWLRFECLLAEFEGRTIKSHELLGLASQPTNNWTKDLGVSRDAHSRQLDLCSSYDRILPYYLSRAKYIRTGDIDDFLGAGRNIWVSKIRSGIYRHRDHNDSRADFELILAASTVATISSENIPNCFQFIRELIESDDFSFNTVDICKLIRPFTWRSEVHGALTEYANQWMPKIALGKISSSEKANAYLAIATLLENVSHETSAIFFAKAFIVLEEIDYHELSLLGIFDRLTSIVAGSIGEEEARSAAISLASFGTDVAMRLRGYDHFPWAALSRAIGRLNAPIALATASRWEDEDLGVNTETIQVVLQEGVKNKRIPVGYAASARYLAERTCNELILEIALASKNSDDKTRCSIQEILAECEALLNDVAPRPEIDTVLLDMNSGPILGRWTRYLKERIEFLKNLSVEDGVDASINHNLSENEHRRVEVLDSLDWSTASFRSAAEVKFFVQKARTVAGQQRLYYLDEKELYRRIRERVHAHHQVVFLDYLSEEILGNELSYTLADGLTDSIEAWMPNSVMVQAWCVRNVPEILSARLIMFTSRMYSKTPLEKLINSRCIPLNRFYESILSGIPECIEKFDARMIYELIQIVAELVPASEVSHALKCYLDRLLSRTATEDRFVSTDLPVDIVEAQARLLYANLGDISLSTRWRAAHAVRAICELECSEVIDQIISRYARRDELSFRAKDAPFYWAAARLWFVIAISRACVDKPSFASRYSDFLLSVLADVDFPHLLVQRFAQKGLQWLEFSGAVKFNSTQMTLIHSVCTSQFQPQKRPREIDRDSDNGETAPKSRRFHFDGMDTLRYWYPGRTEIFADVSLTDFVDEAENWIVDKWGVTENPWRWLDEPRRHKFERYGGGTSHSHGSLPRAERFSTHLEWHAMWCSIGSLMKTHPLNTAEYGGNRLFEDLDNSTVVAPPLIWLSDLRSPKPLETQFWSGCNKNLQWVSEPNFSEQLSILGLGQQSQWLLVSANYNCYWQKFHESVSVTSCLVSRKTSKALLNALQDSTETFGHYLPFDNGGDIDSPPFGLEQWLVQTKGQSGLDEKDDFGENLTSRVSRPDESIVTILGLAPSTYYHCGWHEVQTGELAFYSEQWAERVPENKYHGDWQWMRSAGERLHCKRNMLELVFEHTQRDLLIKIHIYRKQNDDAYDKDDKAQSEYFNTYFLLKQDGSIETVDGPIGTWKTAS